MSRRAKPAKVTAKAKRPLVRKAPPEGAARDAAEWIGPHDDIKLGIHTAARYYYYPGWHEPGATQAFGFIRKAYESLPVDLRRTLDHAAAATQVYGLNDFHAKNAIALGRLRTEFKGKIEIVQLPVPVLRELKKLAVEVVKEELRRPPWPGRSTRRSRSFRRWSAPGTTLLKARTTSSSLGEEVSVTHKG